MILPIHAPMHPPPTIQDIERVNKLTVLGVVINDRLSADNHATATIAACSKSLYALRVYVHTECQLQKFIVYTEQLWCQSWYTAVRLGRASAISKTEIESTLSSSGVRSRSIASYCADEVKTVNELFADADKTLLKQVLANPNQTLQQFLPPINNHDHHLRKRPHNHQLNPAKRPIFQQSNFIIRSLFSDTY